MEEAHFCITYNSLFLKKLCNFFVEGKIQKCKNGSEPSVFLTARITLFIKKKTSHIREHSEQRFTSLAMTEQNEIAVDILIAPSIPQSLWTVVTNLNRLQTQSFRHGFDLLWILSTHIHTTIFLKSHFLFPHLLYSIFRRSCTSHCRVGVPVLLEILQRQGKYKSASLCKLYTPKLSCRH